jgi:DNA-binding MarR family transcriptional regulator
VNRCGEFVKASEQQETGLLTELARFRYQLRLFLRFSERAARAEGVTPQQHQLMLGVAGHTGKGWATISELADFLQERHNAVVGLVERAVQRGLVTKKAIARDHRFVRVALTPEGRRILGKLAQLHRGELARFQNGIAPLHESEDKSVKAWEKPQPAAKTRPRSLTRNERSL